MSVAVGSIFSAFRRLKIGGWVLTRRRFCAICVLGRSVVIVCGGMVGSFFSPSDNYTPDGGGVALRGAPFVGIKSARVVWTVWVLKARVSLADGAADSS